MSHVATVDIIIMDLDALAAAAERCGLKLMWDQKTWRWYSRWMKDYHGENAAYRHGIDPKEYGKCLHAITIPGNNQAYEIGIVKNPNGEGYKLLFDFWQGGYGMAQHVGEDPPLGKLVAQYAREVAIREAQSQGYSVTEKVDEYGNIELSCEDYNYQGH